jgi:hypothetical protein
MIRGERSKVKEPTLSRSSSRETIARWQRIVKGTDRDGKLSLDRGGYRSRRVPSTKEIYRSRRRMISIDDELSRIAIGIIFAWERK